MSNKGVCEKMRERDINGGVCKERRGTHVCVYSSQTSRGRFLEMFDAYFKRESYIVSCTL